MKKTQLDRAIENLEAEKAVLELAIAKLKAQREKGNGKARKPRPVEKATA